MGFAITGYAVMMTPKRSPYLIEICPLWTDILISMVGNLRPDIWLSGILSPALGAEADHQLQSHSCQCMDSVSDPDKPLMVLCGFPSKWSKSKARACRAMDPGIVWETEELRAR